MWAICLLILSEYKFVLGKRVERNIVQQSMQKIFNNNRIAEIDKVEVYVFLFLITIEYCLSSFIQKKEQS